RQGNAQAPAAGAQGAGGPGWESAGTAREGLGSAQDGGAGRRRGRPAGDNARRRGEGGGDETRRARHAGESRGMVAGRLRCASRQDGYRNYTRPGAVSTRAQRSASWSSNSMASSDAPTSG